MSMKWMLGAGGDVWRYVALAGAVAALGGCATSKSQHARTLASKTLNCKAESLRITDAEKGVYLVEGCGRAGTFYCTESRSLEIQCIHVTDYKQVASRGNLSDALNDESLASDKAHKASSARPEQTPGVATKGVGSSTIDGASGQ